MVALTYRSLYDPIGHAGREAKAPPAAPAYDT